MIGELRHLADVTRLEKVDNGRGGWVESPVSIGQMWVAYYRLTSREHYAYRQQGIEADTRFFARYRSDLDNTICITLYGRVYRIVFIEEPADTTDYMTILAESDT